METIAKRTNKALYVTLGFVVSGLVLLALGFAFKKYVWIFGAAITTVALCFLIDFLFQSATPITFDGNNLYIEGTAVSPKCLSDVSSKSFRLGQSDFNWGTIRFRANGKNYAFRYVDNCNEVLEKLKELSA